VLRLAPAPHRRCGTCAPILRTPQRVQERLFGHSELLRSDRECRRLEHRESGATLRASQVTALELLKPVTPPLSRGLLWRRSLLEPLVVLNRLLDVLPRVAGRQLDLATDEGR